MNNDNSEWDEIRKETRVCLIAHDPSDEFVDVFLLALKLIGEVAVFPECLRDCEGLRDGGRSKVCPACKMYNSLLDLCAEYMEESDIKSIESRVRNFVWSTERRDLCVREEDQ